MQYKTVIFDLDGTLLNTLDDLHASTNHALAHHGMPPRTKDEVRRFVGNGIYNLIRQAVVPGTSKSTIQEVHATFDAHYAKHNLDRTAPYEGISTLLSNLKAANVHCCVVSNKGDYAVQPLVQHFFPNTFDVACGEREKEGIRRKPWPDTVLTCMESLGMTRADCVYVGDSEVDVATAQNAGMDHIIVLWGFRSEEFLRQNGARTLVRTPAQLEALLLHGRLSTQG